MFKKFLILFALVTSVLLTASFYPQKIFGANDHVVISQIQISGATATDEFVELYNPTPNAIDLTGFRLSKKISSGTLSNLLTTMSGTITAHGYFLVKHPTGYTGSKSADAQYSTASSITSDNTVILYSDAGTTIVDKVGFGSAFEFETSPFSINPVSGSSIKRQGNADTDNNSLDFVILQTSEPKNSNTILVTPSPTPVITQTPTTQPTEVPIATLSPTASPTQTPMETETPTATATNIPVQTENPTLTPTMFASTTPYPSPMQTGKYHRDREFKFPFGFKCNLEKHEFKFKKIYLKYYKLHFRRD